MIKCMDGPLLKAEEMSGDLIKVNSVLLAKSLIIKLYFYHGSLYNIYIYIHCRDVVEAARALLELR